MSLTAYLRDVSHVKLLSPQEERALACAAARRDEKARAKLVTANLRFVVAIARQYAGRGLPLEDLISAGHEGLLRAVDRFKIRKGWRFNTYAFWWIRCYILRLFATDELVRLPQTQQILIKRINVATERLLQEGRMPTTRQIAKLCRLRCAQVEAISKWIDGKYVSIDDTIDELGGEWLASDAPSLEEIYEGAVRMEHVRRALLRLRGRELTVISRYYGVGTEPRGLRQIAKEMSITSERVRQLRDRALRQLKHILEEHTHEKKEQGDVL